MGENYFEHLFFAFMISLWLIATGIIFLLHGLLPFLFILNTSKSVKKINFVMQKRSKELLKRKAGGVRGKSDLRGRSSIKENGDIKESDDIKEDSEKKEI